MMATSSTESAVGDVTLCSICFEKFKTPRYLPCSHSFCHGCLSSYIVSLCTSTEPRLGFNCPLCREYIPSTGACDKPEEWAANFPVNDVLEKILKSEEKLCDACLRENESEKATGFCFSCTEYLCAVCVKYHNRHLLSRNHTICHVNEMTSGKILPKCGKILRCQEHCKKIKLFCNDHEQPCCLMCIGTNHKKCENVDSVEAAAASVRENGKLDALLAEAGDIERRLTEGRNAQEKNVTELEDSADEMTERTEKEFKEIVDYLEKMKNKHLEEIATAVKRGKEIINKSIDTLADGIQYVNYCSQNIEKAREIEDNTEMLMNYYRAKQNISELKHFNFTRKRIVLCEKKAPILREIKNMKSLADVEWSESEHNLMFNVRTMELSSLSEFSVAGGNVYGGTFLSNDNFAISQFESKGKCSIYGKSWVQTKDFGGLLNPFDMIQIKHELFVTCIGTNSIEVFSASDFHKLRIIPINKKAYGISSWKGALYIACENKIIKTDISGNKVKEYEPEGINNIYIVVTNDGLIVYGNWYLNTVTAITDKGEFAWEYENLKMKEPHGLDADSEGNIFVAAKSSNNIHVLSSAGELLRVLEDIPNPVFIKINEKRNICCVCSKNKIVKVYQIEHSELK